MGDTAQPRYVAGRGRAQFVQAEEGEVAVGVVAAHGGPRGRDRRLWRRNVRVEVLEAEDLRIRAGGARDPVDGETRDAAETGDEAGRVAAHDRGEAAPAMRVRAARTKAMTSSTEEAVATSPGRSRARSRSP